MAIDKLIPQYLNSDTDQKLVKSVEMTDNLNVRVSNDAEGTEGVIKNVKGTEVVSAKTAQDAFPAGDNRVIGSVANEKNKEILFLVWNENNDHGIYRMDMTTGKYQKLYEDSVLNFKKYSYADCDVIVNEEEETLFYWTDNENPPMKLNVNRLIKSQYPSILNTGTDKEKLDILTVAKKGPVEAPTFSFTYNANLGDTLLYEKVFQFAYQYKYTDGEVSALSPFSALTVSDIQYKDGFIADQDKDVYNQINVSVKDSNVDVKEIYIYARKGNAGTFYQIERTDSSDSNNTITVEFSDTKVSRFLSNDEVNKSYDNVPQLAKSLAISGNRLMFGNYTEGYENAFVDASLSPVYYAKPEVFSMRAYNYGTTDKIIEDNYSFYSNNYNNPVFAIDFSNVPATVAAGSEVIIEVSFIADSVQVAKNSLVNFEFGEINFSYVDPESDNVDSASYEVGNPNLVNNLNRKAVRMGLQPVVFSHTEKIANDTTKALFINQVVSSFVARDFYSVIDGNEEDQSVYDYSSLAGLAGSQAVAVFGGRAGWKLEPAPTTNPDIYTFEIFFAGAEVFLKYIWAKTGNWVTNNFTGTKKLNVTESSSVAIGGLGPYSLFNGDSSKDAYYIDYGIAGSSCFGGVFTGSKSYKDGATHEFGIVYLDSKGRAGGVNKIDSVKVDRKSARVRKGAVEMDIRVSSNPPSWAEKWMPVYGRNTTYESFLQYSTSYALAAVNSEKVQSSSFTKRIYVSMATLEGSESSYKEQSGADLEYKFEKGDVLNIIRYDDNGTETHPSGYNFDIVDYKYLSDDEASSFLVQTGKYNNIGGWYVVLEDRDFDGFSYNSVIGGNSLWNKNTLVEFKRRKKENEDLVYYEFGKVYDIVNGEHQGDRTVTSYTGGFVVTIVNTSPKTGTASSSDRYYVGDYVNLGNNTIIEITEVIPFSTGWIYYFNWSRVQPSTGTYGTTTITNPAGVATFAEGDVYHRVRKLRLPNSFFDDADYPDSFRKNSYLYNVGYVEDESISDFFSSKSISIGKPYAHIEDAKTIRRKSSITYSDAYVIDSNRLNLSSFNLSLANWTDLDLSFGAIQALVPRGDAITVIQENKASQIPVGRNLIEYSGGDANVTVSKNVLGIPSYYAGDYGTENPESVVERFGVVYYADVKRGKVVRLSADGITPISEKGLDSFFEDAFKGVLSSTASNMVIGGFDPDNDEYLITVEPNYISSVTIGSNTYEVSVDDNDNVIADTITYTSSTIIWNAVGNLWNTYCGNWEDAGNGVIFIDSLSLPQSVLVDSIYTGSGANIDIIITDSNYSFSATAQLNLSNGIITFPSTTCEGTTITIGTSQQDNIGFTIGYKHKEGVWGSKYSFTPTSYVNINNELYSFLDVSAGLMWKHNSNETRNNFYGTQYNSMFEVVSNMNPSMVKVYEALGVEGDGTWSAVLSNTDQSTTISTSDFDNREGHRYAMIPRDTLVSTGHQIYLGRVEAVSADTVTFTTPVNRLPFVVGDDLYTASGSTLTDTTMNIAGITNRKTIQCTSAVSGISVGDDIFVQHSARVDGDPMRGVFLKLKMTSSDTTPFEVHALSVSYDRSRLHNDRVN